MVKKSKPESETRDIPMLGGQIAVGWVIPGGVLGGPGMMKVGVTGTLAGGKSKKLHIIVSQLPAPSPNDATLLAAPDYLAANQRDLFKFYQEVYFPIVVGQKYLVSALIEWNTPAQKDRLGDVSGTTKTS